ncbi:hypothetical protein LCGC14_2573180, partial [marine sediment metagenome]
RLKPLANVFMNTSYMSVDGKHVFGDVDVTTAYDKDEAIKKATGFMEHHNAPFHDFDYVEGYADHGWSVIVHYEEK